METVKDVNAGVWVDPSTIGKIERRMQDLNLQNIFPPTYLVSRARHIFLRVPLIALYMYTPPHSYNHMQESLYTYTGMQNRYVHV